MKNYVTTTLSIFGRLLLNEGVELFTGTDGSVRRYRCTDKSAVAAAISALQQNIGAFPLPNHAPAGMRQFGSVQNYAFHDPYGSQQYAICRFVCELESNKATGQTYIVVYDEAYPHNRSPLPVTASLRAFNKADCEAKAYSGVYDGSLTAFLADAKAAGAKLKIGDYEQGLFILTSNVSTDSGIAALYAIGQAIRVTEGHRVVSAAKQSVEVSTASTVLYDLAYELLEGHEQLKLFFKDHPTLSVTISVRRIG